MFQGGYNVTTIQGAKCLHDFKIFGLCNGDIFDRFVCILGIWGGFAGYSLDVLMGCKKIAFVVFFDYNHRKRTKGCVMKNLKNSKYYVLSLIASMALFAGACKTEKASVATVTGWGYRGDKQSVVSVDVNGKEVLVYKYNKHTGKINESLPEYAIGDTLYLYETLASKRSGIAFENQIKTKH